MNRKPPIITTPNNTKARSAIAIRLADKAPPDPRRVAADLGVSPIRDHVLAVVLEYETLAVKLRTLRDTARKTWNSGITRAERNALNRAWAGVRAAAE